MYKRQEPGVGKTAIAEGLAQRIVRGDVPDSLKNRTIGLLDNGTWAATAGNQMRTVLESMQNMTILEPVIHIKSALTEAQLPELDALADAVAASL